jgi:membrane-bound lytic murein transglycosylase MltF
VNQYLGGGELLGGTNSASFVRGRPFTQEEVDRAIDEAAARHNVDPNLVRSVVKVESNFNPNAVSRKGAMGLMQLMPQTARQLKVTNPFDPQQNVDAGVRHLKQLMENYGGNLKLRRITELYYGGSEPGSYILGNPVRDPVRVQRDARGVLYISNTD